MNLTKITNNQGLTPEQINLIRRTVAANTTDDELAMFLHIARKYDLDPFMKEIWCIKYKDKVTNKEKVSIFVSRDGYLKIAHQSGVFDGMNSYTIDDEKGNPVKAVCEVYRKDMSRPFRAEVQFKEYYNPNSPSWQKYPSAMLIKVAEVFALRRAFSISGITSEYEIEVNAFKDAPVALKSGQVSNELERYVMSEGEREKVISIVSRFHRTRREKALTMLDQLTREQVSKLITSPPFINDEQKFELRRVMERNGIPEDIMGSYLKEKYDISGIDDITTDIYSDVMQDVSKVADVNVDGDDNSDDIFEPNEFKQ